VQHPTYKAFAELGKAVKTVFLCRYLHDEGLRREIHEAAQRMATQFARPTSSQPIEGFEASTIGGATLTPHYQCGRVRESEVRRRRRGW
jgi:hypothetical protein